MSLRLHLTTVDVKKKADSIEGVNDSHSLEHSIDFAGKNLSPEPTNDENRISVDLSQPNRFVEKSYEYKSLDKSIMDAAELGALREDKNSTQEISDFLAPDEHYALSRKQASEGGFEMFAVTLGQNVGYEALSASGLNSKSGKWNPAPFSWNTFWAGIKGAYHGYLDYIERKRQEQELKETKEKLEKMNPKDNPGIRADFPKDDNSHYSDGTKYA